MVICGFHHSNADDGDPHPRPQFSSSDLRSFWRTIPIPRVKPSSPSNFIKEYGPQHKPVVFEKTITGTISLSDTIPKRDGDGDGDGDLDIIEMQNDLPDLFKTFRTPSILSDDLLVFVEDSHWPLVKHIRARGDGDGDGADLGSHGRGQLHSEPMQTSLILTVLVGHIEVMVLHHDDAHILGHWRLGYSNGDGDDDGIPAADPFTSKPVLPKDLRFYQTQLNAGDVLYVPT